MKKLPWLYHITTETLPEHLTPKRPEGSDDKNQGILKEFDDPRISFAPSVFHCLQALIPSIWEELFSEKGQQDGMDFRVYRLVSQDLRIKTHEELTKERLVWDAHITHEYCVLTACDVLYCGKINAKVDKSDPGLTIYPYNDRKLKPEKGKLCADATLKILVTAKRSDAKIQMFSERWE